jgi:hypothetical protein
MSNEPNPRAGQGPFNLDLALRQAAPASQPKMPRSGRGLVLNLARRIIVAVYVPLAIAAATWSFSCKTDVRYHPFPGIDRAWNTWYAREHAWVWVVGFHLVVLFQWFWWRPSSNATGNQQQRN